MTNENITTEYRPRIMDAEIDRCLRSFGAVCIEGPKWSGKTWSAARHAKSSIYLADPTNNFANRTMTELSMDFALQGESPHLIDEWQEIPELWDAVRFRVDERRERGQYLLTGSSTPVYKGILHSGAGRIARLRMRPMSLYESGDSTGHISLQNVCTGGKIQTVPCGTTIFDLARLTVRGGWPGGLSLPYEDAARIPREYMDAVMYYDIARVESGRRDLHKIQLLMRSLARNESTTASMRTLCRDIAASEDENMTVGTISTYIDILERLFLLENQKPFGFGARAATRIKKAEKRHFADPSLACAVLNLTEHGLMSDPETFGFMFEALCERDLRIYAESFGAQLYHYQDYQGREIDAVIEMPDRSWCAVEIKLGAKQIDAAASNLKKIADSLPSDQAPASLAVVCGLPGGAYQRSDGVYVLPITALRP